MNIQTSKNKNLLAINFTLFSSVTLLWRCPVLVTYQLNALCTHQPIAIESGLVIVTYQLNALYSDAQGNVSALEVIVTYQLNALYSLPPNK